MGSPESFSVLQIKVKPSPETNDHEVCLIGDGKNLIECFAADMMGLDPAELLIEPCPLRGQTTPHNTVIARCNCGVTSCGNVEVEIRQEGDVVEWTDTYSSKKIQFIATQYEAEIDRALQDCSWETPERTAARLIGNSTDRTSLSRRGFTFVWASGRLGERRMTVCLNLFPGPYQVLVNLPWDGEDTVNIVDQFKALLATPAESWPDVECYPQAQGLGPPNIHGPGWRV